MRRGEATGGLLVGGIHHLCDGARDETTAAVWDQGPAASLCGALNKREQKDINMKKYLPYLKKKWFAHFWLLFQPGGDGTG